MIINHLKFNIHDNQPGWFEVALEKTTWKDVGETFAQQWDTNGIYIRTKKKKQPTSGSLWHWIYKIRMTRHEEPLPRSGMI